MVPLDYKVFRGGFEWVGLSAVINNDVLQLEHGRIGRPDNPLTMIEGHIWGGWYVDERTIPLRPTDRRIDVVLYENDTWLLIRSDDPRETYDVDILEILLPLLHKDSIDGPWFIRRPQYSS